MRTIDVDQHLFESRRTWADYIEPADRDNALSIEDDETGWPWLTWQGKQLSPIEVPVPEQGKAIGDDRLRRLRGDPPRGTFEELVPANYQTAAGRIGLLDQFGIDAAVLFPNYGLLWEKFLVEDRAAQRANARAYNRFTSEVCADGDGRLFGVGHLMLHDPAWAVEEIRRLGAAGIRLAMVSPAPVEGKPLSHVDFEPVWRTFSEEGIAPVFHVSGFESPINPAWHVGEMEDGGLFLDSIFLWLAPAIAIANLILSGTLERFPDLRVGVVELTAGWVPSFLLHIDGAADFFAERHGGPFLPLTERPSHYFFRQVRVAALPYEMPNRLVQSVGEDTFMVGSDWPHAEGVADPMGAADRAAAGLGEAARTKLLGSNAAWLLGLEEPALR
jgi:predicted TIM-barrel fold metal-dependent hydrolase